MPSNMMHRNQGYAQRKGHGLGKGEAHQHRTDQARRIGNCNGVNILALQICLLQSLIRKGVNGLNMFSGRDLRYNTAIDPVKIYLRCNAIRKYLSSIRNNSNSRFVTG